MSTALLFIRRNLAVLIVLFMVVGYFVYKSSLTERPGLKLPESERIHVRIERFDSLLYANRFQLNPALIANWYQLYPDFLKLYVEELIGISSFEDPEMPLQLQAFLSDPFVDTLFRDVQALYPNLEDIEKELSEAYSYFYHFFPDQPFYQPIGMVSAFQYKNALSDSILMLGLDLYLGRNYRYYPQVSYITAYMLPRLEPNRLVPDAIRMMIADMLPPMGSQPNLISEMVNEGKALYILQSIMPGLQDSLLLNYTSQEALWAKANELSIWEYLLNENLLYSNDRRIISRLMNDGPFTAGLPQESPSRLGTFTGWKIVSSYMKKNNGVTLPALLQIPSQELLKASGYKGKS